MNPLKHISSLLLAGAVLLGGRSTQAQSSISGTYPDGARLFEASGTLSFTASSPAGVTNVTVQLTVTSLTTGQSFIKNLTQANGLTVSGPTTARSVSGVLTSNTLYTAVITVKDANGSVASQTVNFDTIAPTMTWEAEDWDYSGGQYFDNPQTNAYAGLATGSGDAQNSNGGGAYRPSNPGLSTEGNGDVPRSPWAGTGKTDYDVGFTDGGDYGNYTRHYPPGTYNLFARVAGGNGPRTECADISVVSGNVSISGSGSYKFGTTGVGWQNYAYMPVTDNGGNLIQITFDGNPATLQVLQNQGSDNMNFFMLVPLNTNVVASTVSVTNITPDGSALFNPAGTFSFVASSPTAPVDPNNISVQITATNLWGHGSVTSLSVGSGLFVSGPSTNYTVSFVTTTNTIYSVLILITDVNGVSTATSAGFDTIVPTYTFEAEDFDYGAGNYFDNPQTNAYSGLDGVAEVDFHATQHGGDYGTRIGLTTENLTEKLRPQYNGTGYHDYDVGFNDGGNWGNYTRNYPAGNYNIYVRVANGTGNSTADSGSISLVTSGVGTSSQTLSQLGKFGVPATGGWGNYVWVPVKDTVGNLAQFTGGSLETLRMTIDGGNCNENFFLLTPVDPASVLQPYVDTFQPDGSSMFQSASQLSFVVHSQPGTATGNIALNLNGANVSGLTFSGTANLRNVSYAIQPNTYYTAIVTVTDANGTARLTNSFATYASTNYQFEAEDYDYGNGQYFDNPQVGSYLGLAGVSGSDYYESDVNGPGRSSGSPYRPADTFNIPDSTAGDQARSQFTAASATDYNIGSFGNNSWANYTRHYPAGTYHVVGRFAEGAGLAGANLALLNKGVSTNVLGVFNVLNLGWGTWQWSQLVDGNGRPVSVNLDGTAQVLRLGGTTGNEINANFLMLVPTTPTPKLTATVSGGTIHISFPTQNGYSYQLLYKNHLTDSSWTPLGSAIAGDGNAHSPTDSAVGSRFYQVQVQ
ncbi:MAG TPA: hypothetical protein VG347_14725 [Verrucomicrobiae bacterium]|nr:hypothetical protein [Verrucomicrobiae bacterium]